MATCFFARAHELAASVHELATTTLKNVDAADIHTCSPLDPHPTPTRPIRGLIMMHNDQGTVSLLAQSH
jgi:hypothetical protein